MVSERTYTMYVTRRLQLSHEDAHLFLELRIRLVTKMRLKLSHKDYTVTIIVIIVRRRRNTQHTKCSLFNVQSGINTAETTEILTVKVSVNRVATNVYTR